MKELNSILLMWQKDCIIDSNNLDEASRTTPMLHSKYLQLMSEAKIKLKQAEFEQKKLLKDKWLHYNGKMPQQDIEQRGWEYDPLDGLKILKNDMDRFFDSDPDIQKSEEKITYWKTILDTLKEIIDNLKWRHQTIRNMIDWRRFEAGG